MTRRKFWGLFTALGFMIILLGFSSDLLRGKPLFLGWTQRGMILMGLVFLTFGLLIRLGLFDSHSKEVSTTTIVFFLLVLVVGTLIAYLKIDSLNSWRYTTDLFSFNTVIHENARGNWGLEFTYGNAFGDHAYFFLILLTPLMFLLNSNVIYALILSGPIAYAISSIVFFHAIKQLTSLKRAFLLSTVFLLGFGITYRSLFENRHGVHPDTYSGYIAVSLVALLLWREHSRSHNRKSNFLNVGIILFLTLYIIQKEEMALLATIFFAIVWFKQRMPFHRNLLILSTLFLGFDLFIMRVSQTPFNRTNNFIIDNLFLTIQEDGLRFLFIDSKGGLNLQLIYWMVVIISSIVFLIVLRVSANYHPYTISLFIIGIIKIAFSLSVKDFDFTSWHNFPGLIMMTGAILLHTAIIDKRIRLISELLVVVVAISTMIFFTSDIPFVREQLLINEKRKPLAIELTNELTELKELIQPTRVVAIPKYSERPWVDYRYSLYPRGIYWSPIGIADYLIFPYNNALLLTVDYKTAPPPPSFTEVHRTENYVLYKRISLTEEERINREYFSKYGLDPSIIKNGSN